MNHSPYLSQIPYLSQWNPPFPTAQHPVHIAEKRTAVHIAQVLGYGDETIHQQGFVVQHVPSEFNEQNGWISPT